MLVCMQFLLYKRLFFLSCWLSRPQKVAHSSALTGSKLRTSGSIHPQYSASAQQLILSEYSTFIYVGKQVGKGWYIPCHSLVKKMARLVHLVGCNQWIKKMAEVGLIRVLIHLGIARGFLRT